VKDLQGARDAVDWYAQHDYRQIKIYNSFHPEWVRRPPPTLTGTACA